MAHKNAQGEEWTLQILKKKSTLDMPKTNSRANRAFLYISLHNEGKCKEKLRSRSLSYWGRVHSERLERRRKWIRLTLTRSSSVQSHASFCLCFPILIYTNTNASSDHDCHLFPILHDDHSTKRGLKLFDHLDKKKITAKLLLPVWPMAPWKVHFDRTSFHCVNQSHAVV